MSSIPTTLASDETSILDLLDHSMPSTDLPFEFGATQDYLHTGMTHSPSNTLVSSTPGMQPFSEMQGFLEGMDYNSGSGAASSAAGGLQNPIEFSMTSMPSLPFPVDDLQTIDCFNKYPVSEGVTSSSSRTSGPTSSAHHSDIGSISRASSLSSMPPAGKPCADSGPYSNSVQEHVAVVGAREGWYSFRCNPPTDPSACPKTARIHLEGLEQTLKRQDAWKQQYLQPEISKPASGQYDIKIEPFSTYTRDKLLAITQTFLHKALEIHYANYSNRQSAEFIEGTGFIILPPQNVMEHFLKAYVCRFEPYYTFIPAGALIPNELMQGGNARASSILLLLMVAHGASATPTMEARYLTSGLTEACRISLFDIIEKDIGLVQNLTVLRCGLLFTTVAAWSGDKWHMDVSRFCLKPLHKRLANHYQIAMGQRGMYISVGSSKGVS